jgi:RecB family exonuclease
MRLAYTAMTRARRRVVWTATQAGVDQGERRPSRFLLAAAGDQPVGPPQTADREPITIGEAETSLRRSLLDVSEGPARRLAAARVLGSPREHWWDPASFAGALAAGPDSPVLGETFRLSPSQADSYRRCPRRYVLERRLRLGDVTSVYAHFGELTHEILEIAEREIIGDDRLHSDLSRVLQIIEEVWEAADFGTPELNNAWKLKAIEMLTKLYDNWPGKGHPVEVELDVETEIGGVRWIGRIDRLERSAQGLRVVDYKTGTQAPTKSDAAGSIQLGFYARAVAEIHGEVVASEMWFPRTKTKSVTTRQFALHQLPEVEQTMVDITAGIRDENWPPRVSNDCKRCGFRRSCPAWPEGTGAFLP